MQDVQSTNLFDIFILYSSFVVVVNLYLVARDLSSPGSRSDFFGRQVRYISSP